MLPMKEQFWKYGDNILLVSNLKPQRFLSARSTLEEKVYMLELIDDAGSLTNYDNFSECFFQIVPQLYYEANKIYTTSLSDRTITPEKIQILKKRVIDEDDQNQIKINKYKGKRIQIGDTILIKHLNSNAFIKFSGEKNSNSMNQFCQDNKDQQPIFSVKLSQKIDSGVIFKIKIDPQLSFKKDGELIGQEDSFYFINVKKQSTFNFESQVELKFQYKLNEENNQNNFIRFPSIMERSLAFKIYESVHVTKAQIISTFRVFLNEDIDQNKNNSNNDDNKQIYYGDYVRLKHILKDKKMQSFLNCEFNIAGTCPTPFMEIDEFNDQESVASIFQIVPKNPSQLNRKLMFHKKQQVCTQKVNNKILLRHWLSGKFLNIHRDQDHIVTLNDSLDEKLQQNINLQNASNSQSVSQIMNKNNNKQNVDKRFKQVNMLQDKQILSKSNTPQLSHRSHTVTQQQSEKTSQHYQSKRNSEVEDNHSEKSHSAENEKENPTNINKIVRLMNGLRIVSSQSDEVRVTSQSKFYLQNCYKGDTTIEHMEVLSLPVEFDKLDELDIQQPQKQYNGWLEEGVNYEQVYVKKGLKGKQVYLLQSRSNEYENSADSQDYFFFEHVSITHVQYIQSVLSRMYPIMVLSINPELLLEDVYKDNYVDQVIQFIVKISNWMCDKQSILNWDKLMVQPVNSHKQMIIRQLGLIDAVVKIFYHLQNFGLLDDGKNKNTRIFFLSVVMINFLRLASHKNELNSFYVFQWYQMMKNIVLVTKILPPEIQIDKLLSNLLNMTNLSKEYALREDLMQICSQLIFEKCNNQAINLLLCFCTINKQTGLDKIQQKKIIEEVFIKNKNNIFKDFIYNANQNKLQIKVEEQTTILIDRKLQKQNITKYQQFIINNIIRYIQSTLQLVCNISQGDSRLFIDYIGQLCPFQTCLQVFNNATIPSTIRALFMNIFLNTFMKYDSQYSEDLELPFLLKIDIDLKQNLETGQISKQRQSFEKKYCSSNEDADHPTINIKREIFYQLVNLVKIDLINITSNDNMRITSLIQLINFFLKKNFFSVEEVGKLHSLLDDLIKNSYTILKIKKIQQKEEEENQENYTQNQKSLKDKDKFDVDAAIQWLKMVLDCLYYIELYEQNQMFEMFFTLNCAQEAFSSSLVDVIEQNSHMKSGEIKNLWKKQQMDKQELIIQYMSCLEIPDTEIIYYYLRILDFKNNSLTKSIIPLIWQVFSMRQNILEGFNDIFFVNINNIQFYKSVVEYFNQIQILYIDIENQDDEENEEYQHIFIKLDESLNFLAQIIFKDYIQLKNEDVRVQQNLDECQFDERHHHIEKARNIQPKFFQSQEYIQILEQPDMQIEQQIMVEKDSGGKKDTALTNRMENRIKKSTTQKSAQSKAHVWKILDIFSFDIKTAHQQQAIMRHIKAHCQLMKIISFISKSDMEINQEVKRSILETCFILLIFFCTKNIQNSNCIAEYTKFQQFIRDVLSIKYKSIQIYMLLFIQELFKDNHNLLIKLEKEYDTLLKELQQIFVSNYESNVMEEDENHQYQLDFSIYYIQLLQYFFQIKSTNLIQNQIWIFKVIQETRIDLICKDVLEYCMLYKIKITDNYFKIQVPEKMVFVSNLLNTLIKLIQVGKSNTKLISEVKKYISINDISDYIDELEYWYFLKQELLSFLQVVYINNTKIDVQNIFDLFNLFKGPILRDLEKLLQIYPTIMDSPHQFDTDKKNIFYTCTTYSTREKLINQKVSDNANFYIYFGILQSFVGFCDKFFVLDYECTQDNLNMIEQYQNYFQKIYNFWQQGGRGGNIYKKEFEQKWDEYKEVMNKKSIFLNQQIIISQEKKVFETSLRSLQKLMNKMYLSDRVTILDKLYFQNQNNLKLIDNTWESIQSLNIPIINNEFIQNQHLAEMDIIIMMIVKMKEADHQSFKCVVQNMIGLLICPNTDLNIKDQTIKLIRHLANFNEDEELADEIKKELCSLGYTNFLCEVICKTSVNDSSRYQYIIALVDFLDEGEMVQQSLLDFCLNDKENRFLNMIFSYILKNFNDFKEYEKGLSERAANNESIQKSQSFEELRNVINNKIECCNQAIWILKMSCEGHFEQMQQFLREQINEQGKLFDSNINMIQFGADLFREYITFSDSTNSIFGEKLLDFLIEVIQGPCYENQKYLSMTKILENLEDIMFDLVPDNTHVNILRIRDIDMASFTKRIYIFLTSMFEGSEDPELIEKVQTFIDPLVLIKRLMFIYQNIIKEQRVNVLKKLMKRMNGIIEEQEPLNSEQLKSQIQSEGQSPNQSMIKSNKLVTSNFKAHSHISPPQSPVIESALQMAPDDINNGDIILKDKDIILKEKLKDQTDKQNDEVKLKRFITMSAQNYKNVVYKKKEDVFHIDHNSIESCNEEELFQIEDEEDATEYTLQDMEEQFGSKIEELRQEGDQIFILLRLLSFQSEVFRERLAKVKKEIKNNDNFHSIKSLFQNTNRYYKTNTGRIEIINEQNQIQIIFFAKPDVSKYLSESTKEKFLENVKRDQPNDKIKGLLDKTTDFIDEMNHFKFIMTNIPFNLDLLFTRTRWIVLVCASFLNFMILFDTFQKGCIECDGEYGLMPGHDSRIEYPCVCADDSLTLLSQPIKLFGLVIFAFNILNFVLWTILKLKLDLLNAFNSFDNMIKEQKKLEKFKTKSSALLLLPTEVIKAAEFMKEFMIQNVHKYIYVFQYMSLNSYFLYLSLYAFITILGITANRIFFTLLLLDIVERSLMLQNIMRSVTENIEQLVMMMLLGCVILYIYAMLGYYSKVLHSTFIYIAQDDLPVCSTPMSCLMYCINIGLRNGGGAGETLQQPDPNKTEEYTFRFIYDLSFFIIVLLIWMKVIFGIIIDTFGQLREEKNDQDTERKNNCFICSLDKTLFEKQGIFFEQHTENEHGTWNYLLYIVFLKQKDAIDYTGTESFVFDKFTKDDISWFPINKSLSLQSIENVEDEEQENQQLSKIDSKMKELIQRSQDHNTFIQNQLFILNGEQPDQD